ncbi:MAG: EI24 domain-containing protein [Verrucomicrobiales bacterium]|nr:EI24 domain-containing protein [Verrucomicrobiales bacterium]
MASKTASSGSFLSGVINGITIYFRVPRILFRYKLWPFQLLPAVISLFLSIALFWIFYLVAGRFSEWMDGLIRVPIEWLDQTITITMAVLTFIALAAGFFFVHKHLVLIALAPFLGTIAEETMKAVKGDSYVKSDLGIVPSLGRSAQINLRYILREIVTNLGFLCCGIIPLFGSVVSATGMFLTQARFLGYGLMDFPLENRGLSVNESDRFAHQRKGLSVGIGAGYLLLMMIPFVGWMFAPTFGTVAGTLRAIEELDAQAAE